MKDVRVRLILAVVAIGGVIYAAVGAVGDAAETSSEAVRVGVFDSRAVALAYGRSDAFNRRISAMHAEHTQAKEKGDDKRVAELETEGPALQELLGKQVFGTYPVDDILDTMRDALPDIATEAGVDAIVSKWDVVYQRDGVEFVDVTDLMVKPFNPDEKTQGIIADLRKKDPVPLEQLKGHDD